ncbi:hypothetical protein WHI96_19955 [Pseudonocardia tropica]|uniref:Uncharacterized protein n=1 Tax=Pseudonocardia tropica TaxID=681289 RepID=A0ABV1JYP0_9PSEU
MDEAGYRAHLDAHRLGLGFDALVFVTVQEAVQDTVQAFESAVDAIEQVVAGRGRPLEHGLAPRPGRVRRWRPTS